MSAFVELARPAQWIKNLAVFAGPVFALKIDAGSLGLALIAFASFCLASSATYAINDVCDREADARHPEKKDRPIARGAIAPGAAWGFAALLLAGSVALTVAFLPWQNTAIIAGYFGQNLLYSFALKRRMILDVILIAIGFVLRAAAGAQAVEASISPWLLICTFTLCLFLGFGKRRCEIAQFDSPESAKEHRATLLHYTPELLNHLISVSAGAAIMTFLLYTMDRDPALAPPFPKQQLLYTFPLVVYGIFRYAMLIQSGKPRGPMDIFLKDRPFQGTIALWGLAALAIVTQKHWLDAFGLR